MPSSANTQPDKNARATQTLALAIKLHRRRHYEESAISLWLSCAQLDTKFDVTSPFNFTAQTRN
jgi:hypothetical protein